MLGLRDYVNKNQFPGVVIGLSGGIDSALSAAVTEHGIGLKVLAKLGDGGLKELGGGCASTVERARSTAAGAAQRRHQPRPGRVLALALLRPLRELRAVAGRQREPAALDWPA